MSEHIITYVRDLAEPVPAAHWPAGITRQRFTGDTAPQAHALLAEAYTNGFSAVTPFDNWHAWLVADDQYDPDFCFLYSDGETPAAFALVWTSGFIKDVAVALAYRRQGIGSALLFTVFDMLRARGKPEVGLKVYAENTAAIALYESCGMRALD